MKKLWLKNHKLIITKGKVTVCTECPCELDLCDLQLSNAGGDEGYAVDLPLKNSDSDIPIGLKLLTYFVRDRLVICLDPTAEIPSGTITEAAISGTVLYDSDCIRTNYNPVYEHLTVPAGVKKVRLIMIPNCEGTTGTAWDLQVVCCCPCEEEGAEDCCPCYENYLLWVAGQIDDYKTDCCPYINLNGTYICGPCPLNPDEELSGSGSDSSSSGSGSGSSGSSSSGSSSSGNEQTWCYEWLAGCEQWGRLSPAMPRLLHPPVRRIITINLPRRDDVGNVPVRLRCFVSLNL